MRRSVSKQAGRHAGRQAGKEARFSSSGWAGRQAARPAELKEFARQTSPLQRQQHHQCRRSGGSHDDDDNSSGRSGSSTGTSSLERSHQRAHELASSRSRDDSIPTPALLFILTLRRGRTFYWLLSQILFSSRSEYTFTSFDQIHFDRTLSRDAMKFLPCYFLFRSSSRLPFPRAPTPRDPARVVVFPFSHKIPPEIDGVTSRIKVRLDLEQMFGRFFSFFLQEEVFLFRFLQEEVASKSCASTF